MSAQVIQIGKRRWLAGMDWRTYADLPSTEEIKQDAEQTDSTWVALRTGEYSIQGGFCPALQDVSLGHLNGRINGLYSLAAMLADSRQQPWLGTFKLADDLWWYIAVRDGHAIIPKGDVLGDREIIDAARDEHSGLTDWNYVSGDLTLLESLIDEVLSKEKPTPIKSLNVNWKLRNAMAAAGLITFAVLASGAYWWKDQADKKAAAELALIRAQALQNLPPPITASNVKSYPFASELFASCASRLDREISEFGWVIDDVSCDTKQAMFVWKRMNGATIEYRPDGTLSEDGMTVTRAIDLSIEQSSSDDRTELTNARHKLLAWAQAGNISLSFQSVEAQALPGSDPNAAPPPPPEIGVTINLTFSPFDLDLSKIPGLRIHNIKPDKQGQWTLNGVLYGI